MKKIAFMSNGCQNGFCKAREIVAADPDCREVSSPENADVLMVNFCAISAESIDGFENFCREIIQHKMANPRLKIMAGGCIEGMAEKKDLGFADAVFHHQGEAEALAEFLGKEKNPTLAPFVANGVATINIAQGCNRRCSFCKVHFLDHMRLNSRSLDEILDLAEQAIGQGTSTIVLAAENATEYGLDIGTNLQVLLERLLAMEGLRILDIYGLCLDEVTPELLQILKHPKIRALQLETQSLNDQIRKNMNLRKTTAEALVVLDALSDKFLISNLMTGFPGHSVAEFAKEMRLVRAHHLYFLSLDPYDDTPGVPSHELYEPIDKATERHYQETFLRTVAKERQLLLKHLMSRSAIEASVVSTDGTKIRLYASHYAVEIRVEQQWHHYRMGDIVRVKVTGLHESVPPFLLESGLLGVVDAQKKQLLETMKYFDIADSHQFMLVNGKIMGNVS